MSARPCEAQDQAKAATQQESLVEEVWTYGFAWPKPTDDLPPKRAGVLVWTAPDAKRIRAMLLIANNSDSKLFGMHAPLRDVAAKHEMAGVFLRAGNFPEIQEILDMVGEGTGIAEFRHAPWIPFGKSSRGDFPHNLMWLHPKRTIAGINYHGAVPPWPPQVATKLEGETILYCNANGENEWAGTWYLHVRGELTETATGRLKKMLIHLISDPVEMQELGVARKFNLNRDFLLHLKAIGRNAADRWLDANFSKLGIESSIDIRATFL